MPAFPALLPSSRTFTPGGYIHAAYQSLDGRQTNVAHSNAMISSRLALQFIGLSESDMLTMLAHYHGQLSGFASFQVPAETFSAFPDLVVGTGAAGAFGNYRWRYTSSPTVEEFPSAADDIRFTVAVTLETVPPIGAIVAGALFALPVTLAAGVVTASSAVGGVNLPIRWSLTAGPAAAYLAPGASLSITWTLAAGAVDVGVDGMNRSISWTLTAGNASNLAPGISIAISWALVGGAASSS